MKYPDLFKFLLFIYVIGFLWATYIIIVYAFNSKCAEYESDRKEARKLLKKLIRIYAVSFVLAIASLFILAKC